MTLDDQFLLQMDWVPVASETFVLLLITEWKVDESSTRTSCIYLKLFSWKDHMKQGSMCKIIYVIQHWQLSYFSTETNSNNNPTVIVNGDWSIKWSGAVENIIKFTIVRCKAKVRHLPGFVKYKKF